MTTICWGRGINARHHVNVARRVANEIFNRRVVFGTVWVYMSADQLRRGCIWDQEVGSSNLPAPTRYNLGVS